MSEPPIGGSRTTQPLQKPSTGQPVDGFCRLWSKLMIVCCPHCQSTKVITRNYGRKVGGAIGTAAGAAAAVPRTIIAIETGALAARFAGPIGLIAGSMAGYVLSGLIGGYFGNAAGTALGEVIDENILDNFQCLRCKRKFSRPTQARQSPGMVEQDFPFENDE